MKRLLYDQIIIFIKNHPAKLFRDVVKDVAQKFKDEASEDTLLSICLIQHQKNVKKTFMVCTAHSNLQHAVILKVI